MEICPCHEYVGESGGTDPRILNVDGSVRASCLGQFTLEKTTLPHSTNLSTPDIT
jgi:hypothetical protein